MNQQKDYSTSTPAHIITTAKCAERKWACVSTTRQKLSVSLREDGAVWSLGGYYTTKTISEAQAAAWLKRHAGRFSAVKFG